MVTGTLLDGSLRLGQDLILLPRGLTTRARGLQSHQAKIDLALPGRRVAVNLGGLATEEVQRGDVVTVAGGLRPTAALDVRLRLLRDAPRPLSNATTVGFHSGTAEAVGKVTLLDRDALAPGEETWAQIRLRSPVAVAKNDLFIIRQLSPGTTLGGGQIVDPAPARRHRRRQPAVLAALETLARGTPEEIVLQTLELHEPADPASLVRASALGPEVAQGALECPPGRGAGPARRERRLLPLRLAPPAGAGQGAGGGLPPPVPAASRDAPGGAEEPPAAPRPPLHGGAASAGRRGDNGGGGDGGAPARPRRAPLPHPGRPGRAPAGTPAGDAAGPPHPAGAARRAGPRAGRRAAGRPGGVGAGGAGGGRAALRTPGPTGRWCRPS